jgi:hypothetical protein
MSPRTKLLIGGAGLLLVVAAIMIVPRALRLWHACTPVPEAERGNYTMMLAQAGPISAALATGHAAVANALADKALEKLGSAGGFSSDEHDAIEAAKKLEAVSDFEPAVRIKQSLMNQRMSAVQTQEHMSERCHAAFHRLGLQ